VGAGARTRTPCMLRTIANRSLDGHSKGRPVPQELARSLNPGALAAAHGAAHLGGLRRRLAPGLEHLEVDPDRMREELALRTDLVPADPSGDVRSAETLVD
jgi:hypothetical protein